MSTLSGAWRSRRVRLEPDIPPNTSPTVPSAAVSTSGERTVLEYRQYAGVSQVTNLAYVEVQGLWGYWLDVFTPPRATAWRRLEAPVT